MWFSRSWRCFAVIAPEGFLLRRSTGRGSEDQTVFVSVEPEAAGDWRLAVKAFEGSMATLPKGARLSIILSNRLARFLTVPWSDQMLSPEGSMEFIKGQFDAVFGNAAAGWSYAAEDLGRHRSRVVGAADTDMVEALRDAVRSHHGHVTSIAPWIVHAIKRFGRELGPDGWFAAIEPGQVALAELGAGAVLKITQTPWRGECALEIRRAVRRAALRSGHGADLPIWVASPGSTDANLGAVNGLRLLPIAPVSNESTFWGALAGVLQ